LADIKSSSALRRARSAFASSCKKRRRENNRVSSGFTRGVCLRTPEKKKEKKKWSIPDFEPPTRALSIRLELEKKEKKTV